MRSFPARLLLIPALSLAALGACSDDADDTAANVGSAVDEASDDAVEVAARNVASEQGEDEFGNKGIDLEGDLTCEATVKKDADQVAISCTGTSTDGKDLEMKGTTDEIPGASVTELEGSFVGTADGDEVFSVETLGS